MKPPILSLLLATASLLPAGTPSGLDTRPPNDIVITTDTLGELRITPEVNETSEGRWVPVGAKQTGGQASGREVETMASYPFPGGTAIDLTLTGKTDGESVAIKASWPTDSTAKGFARLTLKLPYELANDLTIEQSGGVLFTNFDQSRYLKPGGDILFKRTSNGEFLFKLIGDVASGDIIFNADKPENGITLRISTTPNGMESLINEATESGWKLSFKE